MGRAWGGEMPHGTPVVTQQELMLQWVWPPEGRAVGLAGQGGLGMPWAPACALGHGQPGCLALRGGTEVLGLARTWSVGGVLQPPPDGPAAQGLVLGAVVHEKG